MLLKALSWVAYALILVAALVGVFLFGAMLYLGSHPIPH